MVKDILNNYGYIKWPFGYIEIIGNEDEIFYLNMIDKAEHDDNARGEVLKAKIQVEEYLNKQRKEFDIKCHLQGTQFQVNAWNALTKIPYGQTKTYKQQAIMCDCPNGSRAIGNANNKNKIGIIIPCHRVIGSNQKLVGYAGGLHIKEYLLNLEKETQD